MLYKDTQPDINSVPPKILEDLLRYHTTPHYRIIAEALFLDSSTPPELFFDLFGWESETIANYKTYFFKVPPNLPKLHLYEIITTIELENIELTNTARELFQNVYDSGWVFIDQKFNGGKIATIQTQSMVYLRKLMNSLEGLVRDFTVTPSINKVKPLVMVLKEAVNIENAAKSAGAEPEQLIFQFVQEVQDKVNSMHVSKEDIMGLSFNELCQYDGTAKGEDSKDQDLNASLTEILEDVKPCQE